MKSLEYKSRRQNHKDIPNIANVSLTSKKRDSSKRTKNRLLDTLEHLSSSSSSRTKTISSHISLPKLEKDFVSKALAGASSNNSKKYFNSSIVMIILFLTFSPLFIFDWKKLKQFTSYNDSELYHIDQTKLNNNQESKPIVSQRNEELNGLRSIWADDEDNSFSDVPIFFHIAKSGGTTIKNILTQCHHKVLASEVGTRNGHDQDQEVKIVSINGYQFVNVDTTTKEGIDRAKQMNFIPSLSSPSSQQIIIISPFLYEIDSLFSLSGKRKGRVFCLFRHPVERAVSMFHYLQYATWESSYNPQLANMTLQDYATSKYIENNYMTRMLSGQYYGAVMTSDYIKAISVLKQKVLVGLQSNMMLSWTRFEHYFDFDNDSMTKRNETCRMSLLNAGSNVNKNRKPYKIQEESLEYRLIAKQNQYDLQVYNLALSLFEEQEVLVDTHSHNHNHNQKNNR